MKHTNRYALVWYGMVTPRSTHRLKKVNEYFCSVPVVEFWDMSTHYTNKN